MPAIPAIILGGASIGSTILQSRAAGKAADTQERGAADALALQRQMYEQGRADLAPFRQGGAAAFGTLGGLMGLPMGAGGGGPDAGTQPPDLQARLRNAFDTMPTNPEGNRGFRNVFDRANRAVEMTSRSGTNPRFGFDPARARTQSSYGGGGSLSSLGRPAGGQRMVLMIGPDGDREQIPEADVPELERMGARRA